MPYAKFLSYFVIIFQMPAQTEGLTKGAEGGQTRIPENLREVGLKYAIRDWEDGNLSPEDKDALTRRLLDAISVNSGRREEK